MHGQWAKLQRNPRDQEKWQRARNQLLGGDSAKALSGYRALTRSYPAIGELWFELGNAASGLLDFGLANRAYQRARALAAHNAPLLGLIGQQYQGLRQPDDARACYEAARRADPASIDARINLAVWFEKERRLDDAAECIESCLAQDPGNDQARYFRAFLLHRRKDDAAAERELRQLIHDGPRYPYVQYAAPHLLGVVLDRLGQYDEALRWLLEAKARVRTITDTSVLENAYDETERRRREIIAALTPETLRRWRDAAPGSPRRLSFLGGHPRSGTTLLEQILGAHPELAAFDESVAFHQQIAAPLERATGTAEIPHLRSHYLASLLREVSGTTSARVLLDKNPSATASLPAWLRVFPDLKVVIALRDPRDVVISCFFLNIMLNATNVNFLSLERTVRHYSDLMESWLRMRDLGGFDSIESRYEDVVRDLETEGRRVTNFLGLDWHPGQAAFHEKARARTLYAPTYHDVTQPVHTGAIGRWHHYAAALDPHLERISPYLRAFGYAG